jgi:hypothetical protein
MKPFAGVSSKWRIVENKLEKKFLRFRKKISNSYAPISSQTDKSTADILRRHALQAGPSVRAVHFQIAVTVVGANCSIGGRKFHHRSTSIEADHPAPGIVSPGNPHCKPMWCETVL